MGILKIPGSIPEYWNLALAFACGFFFGLSKILTILHLVVLTREQRENDHMEIVYVTLVVSIAATVAGSISAWNDHFSEWTAAWTVGVNIPFTVRGIVTMVQDRRILREIAALRTQIQEVTSTESDLNPHEVSATLVRRPRMALTAGSGSAHRYLEVLVYLFNRRAHRYIADVADI